MKTYIAGTNQEIQNPDLTKGYTYFGTIDVGVKYEVMEGSVEKYPPNGLQEEKIIYEECQFYHKYTQEEIGQKRDKKLQELSSSCNSMITNGTDVQLYGGITKHFTYSLEDQSNIGNMFNAVAMGATQFPYHAGNESCEVYSAQDIVTIYATLSAFTTSQTTYHNMLKQYVESLETVPEIQSVTYGQELTGEYLENYNEMLKVANEQMQIVLSKATQYTV